MADEKKKTEHKGVAVRVCPEHGPEFRPVTFSYDDQPDDGEVVYESESPILGYSPRYAANWDSVFGNKEDDTGVN